MPKLKIINSQEKLNIRTPYATEYQITRTASGIVLLKLNVEMCNLEIEIESSNPVVIG